LYIYAFIYVYIYIHTFALTAIFIMLNKNQFTVIIVGLMMQHAYVCSVLVLEFSF
jgi:hypothetical protein